MGLLELSKGDGIPCHTGGAEEAIAKPVVGRNRDVVVARPDMSTPRRRRR